ncbi:hypothetical protein MUK42_17016 [Musa troglodytarum]|uniref:Uncharacterized protein n=1 Tax=Musa troglodytarum TaxID=320322 RepID=A0A9E7HHY7_9LILI|nr:hypothetical protein MUK42_17016 [Musa troglodytarum]
MEPPEGSVFKIESGPWYHSLTVCLGGGTVKLDGGTVHCQIALAVVPLDWAMVPPVLEPIGGATASTRKTQEQMIFGSKGTST